MRYYKKEELPKVLVLGQAFHYQNGGGVTISNLFNGWDKDRLYSTVSDTENPSYDVCSNYYYFNYKERTPKLLWRFVRRKAPLKFDDSLLIKNEKSKPANFKYRIRFLIYRIITYLGFNHLLHNFSVSDDLKKWIIDIGEIDVIYAQYADFASMSFVNKIVNHLKKPLVVHFMDDWIESGAITNVKTAFYESWLSRTIWKALYKQLFISILNKSKLRLCISEEMAEEYKRRYRMDFNWIHNYVNLDQWDTNEINKKESNEFIISYFGTIDVKNLECFQTLCNAIKLIDHANLLFDIYTNDKSMLLNLSTSYSFIRFKRYLNSHDYRKAVINSSILFLPLGFSDRALKYVRYSIPTKLSEFLISGSPVLVFASKDTTLAKFCNNTKSAVVVSKKDPSVLAAEIKALIDNVELRQEYSKTGIKTAKKLFSKDHIQNKFIDLIIGSSKSND